jgi:hypothetical protein
MQFALSASSLRIAGRAAVRVVGKKAVTPYLANFLVTFARPSP